MMMQMIDRGGIPALTDEIRQADEDNPKGYYEFEPVKRTKQDASWLEAANGKVVKMVYRLLYDLPHDREYRIVFMRRRLEEVIASQDLMLERSGKQGGALGQAQLLKTFAAELNKVYAWLAEQPNFKVLYVTYNDMVSEPAPLVNAINEFLGGGLDSAAMNKVVDPALYRQRR